MYKMKEVCQQTGLSEKAVRFYIDQKLISPQIEPGLHYKAYRFSDSDIRQLKDIAALRSAEFSVAEIRTMLSEPDAIPAIIAEKEKQLSEKLASIRSAKDALGSLTVQEQTDYTKVADAIDPQSPLRKETPKDARSRPFWLAVYAGFFLILGFAVTGGRKPWLVGAALLFLAGIEFPLKSVTYFRYNSRWRGLPCRATGKIISVISDEGIEDCWEPTVWDTLHNAVHVGFLHWSWICPDHWIPLIQFEAEGKTVTTAYRYGLFRNSWEPGNSLEIAWEPGKELQIYPCGDPAIRRKAWAYLLIGLGALILFIGFTAAILA